MKDNIQETRALLPIGPSAKKIHSEITKILRRLYNGIFTSCLDNGFRELYFKAMNIYDNYQKEVVAPSGLKIACRSGCSICCCHYAEDIYSFEAEIISDYIKSERPDIASAARRSCANAVMKLERIKDAATDIGIADKYREIIEDADEYEVILKSYYQLKNRCPLLDDAGLCVIYRIRPLTCRSFINLGDPSVCPPEMINESDTYTYILDLDGEANDLLDELHYRYEKFPGDTALCSLVLKYLTEDT